MKKLFILAMGLFLQGSSFCAPAPLSPPDTPSAAPASTPGSSGCKVAYVEGFSLQPPSPQTIFVDQNAWAFLDQGFRTSESAESAIKSQLKFVQEFLAVLKKAQSICLFFKCSFDEKKSFAVDLTFLEGRCTKVTIYGSWPTPPPQIFEFVKRSVLQNGKARLGNGIFIAAGALGVAAVAGVIRSNSGLEVQKAQAALNEEEAQKVKKAQEARDAQEVQRRQQQELQDRAENERKHSQNCRNGYCSNHGGFSCDGWGETDKALWAQKDQERKASKAAEAEQKLLRRKAQEAQEAQEALKQKELYARRAAEIDARLEAEAQARRLEVIRNSIYLAYRTCKEVLPTDVFVVSSRSKYVVDSKYRTNISCLAYDLANFNRGLVTAGDERVFIVGVSELGLFGFNPAIEGPNKCLADILIENVQNFKDRFCRIIIVEDLEPGTPNDALAERVLAAFNNSPVVYACWWRAPFSDVDLQVFLLGDFEDSVLASRPFLAKQLEDQVNNRPVCFCCKQPDPDSCYGMCRCAEKTAVGHARCLNMELGRRNVCPNCGQDSPCILPVANIA